MANPTYTETVRQDLFAEPLGGPIHPDQILDSFPDSLYDKSPQSHFYRFMYAILGPSGVGQLVKNYFEARLKFLEYGVELFDIEKFYGDPLAFGRILEEHIVLDVEGLLSEAEWQKIKSQDASYRSRALEFFNAVRLGTSPEGMRLAAKSGYGHDVEIVERYKWIFDNVSDQPLGYKDWGHTLSTNEFTIIPRKEIGTSEIQRIKFEADTEAGNYVLSFGGFTTVALDWNANPTVVEQALRDLPNIGSSGVRVTGGPSPLPFEVQFVGGLSDEDVPEIKAISALEDGLGKPMNIEVETALSGIEPVDEMSKIPDRLAHNMQEAVDRLRPVNSLPTVNQATGRVAHREWNDVEASSNYEEVVRYVTGRTDVNWPGFNKDINKFWIRPGVEKAAPRKLETSPTHYTNFHKIESVHAYRGEALDSDSYSEGIPGDTFISYRADHFKDAEPFIWKPEYMIDQNTDSRSVTDGLIQGIYPTEYASLSGVPAPVNQEYHWKSISREPDFSEVVEIDLGRAQVVNFLTFDTVRCPLAVEIDFEAHDLFPLREYTPVVPTDANFSGHIDLNDSPYELQWQTVSCQFTDRNGHIPITRFLRLKFTRRADLIPSLSLTEPLTLPFSVCVRGLKVGRSVS